MPANTEPRYTIVGDYSSNATTTSSATMGATAITATGDFSGVSANHVRVFTADSTNGSRIVGLHFEALGTNVQTVARIYINNGGAQTTTGNNAIIGQLTLPATTTSNTTAVGSADFYFPGPSGYADLPPGFTIWVGLGTTVASGWEITPILGAKF
jgi:hypothetical protein